MAGRADAGVSPRPFQRSFWRPSPEVSALTSGGAIARALAAHITMAQYAALMATYDAILRQAVEADVPDVHTGEG